MPTLSEMRTDECRACSNVRGNIATPVLGVYVCAKCSAVFGTCYLGDSYTFVKPWMAADQVPAERTRYFDFTTLGSKGLGRRHGWYDPNSGLITQVG